MTFNPSCLINIFLALLALAFYIKGSYRFYKNKNGYIFFLGLAIVIDAVTAILASLKITPTSHHFDTDAVPWYSFLFNIHVVLSMIGFTGFIFLFFYLLSTKRDKQSSWIRNWQFRLLLPVWLIGETIALSNALSKIIFKIRIFDLL